MHAEKKLVKRKIKKNGKYTGQYKTVEIWRARDRATGTILPCENEQHARDTSGAWNIKQKHEAEGLSVGNSKDLKKYKVPMVVMSYLVNRRLNSEELAKPETELRKDLKKELVRLRAKFTREERKVKKLCAINAFDSLWEFSKHKFVRDKTLYQLNKPLAQRYIDARLNDSRSIHQSTSEPQQISAQAIYWEAGRIRLVWKWAKKYFHNLDCLTNPWERLEWPPGASISERDRELVGDELERLIEACKRCTGVNRYYLPLGIYLFVETGMRREEILGNPDEDILPLHWEDIDFARRRITIQKTKTSNKPIEIVLPRKAKILLDQLQLAKDCDGHLPGLENIKTNNLRTHRSDFPQWARQSALSGRIFPMSAGAFSDAFTAACIRARIKDLHLHDLRQTATTIFKRAFLDPEERQVMLRHIIRKNRTMEDKHYSGEVSRNIMLERIQDKLDRYARGGRTVGEYKKAIDDQQAEFNCLCKDGNFDIDKARAVMTAKYPEWKEKEQLQDMLASMEINTSISAVQEGVTPEDAADAFLYSKHGVELPTRLVPGKTSEEVEELFQTNKRNGCSQSENS